MNKSMIRYLLSKLLLIEAVLLWLYNICSG